MKEITSAWLKGVFAGADDADGTPILGFVLGWTARGGFGEVTFRTRGEKLEYDAETLSKESVRRIFEKFLECAEERIE